MRREVDCLQRGVLAELAEIRWNFIAAVIWIIRGKLVVVFQLLLQLTELHLEFLELRLVGGFSGEVVLFMRILC